MSSAVICDSNFGAKTKKKITLVGIFWLNEFWIWRWWQSKACIPDEFLESHPLCCGNVVSVVVAGDDDDDDVNVEFLCNIFSSFTHSNRHKNRLSFNTEEFVLLFLLAAKSSKTAPNDFWLEAATINVQRQRSVCVCGDWIVWSQRGVTFIQLLLLLLLLLLDFQQTPPLHNKCSFRLPIFSVSYAIMWPA